MVVAELFDGDKKLGSGVQDPGRELETENWSGMEGMRVSQSQKVGGRLFASLGGLREEVWESFLLSLHFSTPKDSESFVVWKAILFDILKWCGLARWLRGQRCLPSSLKL